ncbi:putative kinase [Perkinsus olseni]|uniref:Putative kinase n=1 Tax=Perkinsus olseni TaxID=32597 RepID=A0A7J6P4E1_PEROL|nr:putative kinase [Perkinsus olseni]KAF4709434.1 putative kinase [Perkinsus olseni]
MPNIFEPFLDTMACPPEDISITDLAAYLLTSSSPRLLVGVVGAPGAGKSAVSSHLVAEINRRTSADTGSGKIFAVRKDSPSSRSAILVPLDGFHYTRHYLDTQMPDPVKAKRYRGAHWTFDKDAFSKCLGRLKGDDDVDCPEFDHRVHDPEEGKIIVRKNHRIVVVEGLWVFYPPWGLADEFDVKVLVRASEENRQERVVARHVAGGIEGAEEAALRRYLDNDKPNGDLVLSALPQIDYVIDNNAFNNEW